MRVAHDQAMIEKFGGGIGFSLSALRPKGHGISTTHGKACGPVHVLRVLSQVGTMITQGGKRDGAHMAIMEVYHPDIEEFIHCKNTEGQITNFNISVGADSNFMQAVRQDQYIHLTWPLDRNYYDAPIDNMDGRFIKATDLYNAIIKGAWTNGEPGMVWLDRINQDNSTPALGQINATNPCGEQPLLSGESCNLGSINVGKFIEYVDTTDAADVFFDEERFAKVVTTCVRFLDNVVDANQHPTEYTTAMNQSTRKIGLGIMGFADLLVRLNIPYDSDKAVKLADKIGSVLKEHADQTSAEIGKQKGSFPAFDKSPLNKINDGAWETMRNAWRLSIAPTGTISMIANCSSGIEPLFALAYKKHNMSAALENMELFYINDDLKQRLDMSHNAIAEYLDDGHSIDGLMDPKLRKVFTVSDEIHYDNHIIMQATFQKYVDSGISKTINLPSEATESDIAVAYDQAWDLNCKGITVYRRGSREREVLVSTANMSETTTIEAPGSRPSILVGSTTVISTGHGKMYVTVNYDKDQMYEVFATIGKTGKCQAADTEAMCRLISTAIQYGIPVEVITKQLLGITCCSVWNNGKMVLSLADGIGQVLSGSGGVSIHANGHGDATTLENFSEIVVGGSRCPECDGALSMLEGCSSCMECGYSKCG
jgi:ribonucleoside-diphosphate reductase alpha chain